MELFLGSEPLDYGGPLRFTDRQILMGAGNRNGAGQFHVVNAPRQPKVQMAVVPTAAGHGYSLEVDIPWSVIGVEPKAGPPC
jgi:hypothetical protein